MGPTGDGEGGGVGELKGARINGCNQDFEKYK